LTSKVGYGLIDKFGDVKIPRDTGDFRLLDRIVIDELKRFPEAHGFLRGLVALVGYKQTEVIFDRPARHSGKGNYNRFFGSFKIGLNGIVGFSSALLNLSTVLGFLAAVTSFVLGASYVLLQILDQSFPIGNPTIVAVVLFVIIAGAFYINTANWTPFIPNEYTDYKGDSHFGIGGVLTAATIVFFAYIGFDAVSTQAGEAKNPKKDIPFAIMASLIICTILYILVSLVSDDFFHFLAIL
jgi:uncharacterized membrane protein YphA (DoxX/SURF4 family)